jgi:MerR family redox-sensitive transcriptional activator SoxR
VSETSLTIGQLAKRVGLRPSAIRFYERQGVLPEPERVGGRRRYGEDTLRRLQIVATAKRAGFSLTDAKLLLDGADAGAPAHRQIRDLANRKLPEIDALILRAEAIRGWLQSASACSCESLEACALFDQTAPDVQLLALSDEAAE